MIAAKDTQSHGNVDSHRAAYGLDRQIGRPLAAAGLLASGLALGYFGWYGPESAEINWLLFIGLMILTGIVAFLAAGLLSAFKSLHDRIEILERRIDDGRG